MDDMKALSIIQPWASAIAECLKRFETRSWSTSYRGPILICASKQWRDQEALTHYDLWRKARDIYGSSDPRVRRFGSRPPVGSAVALADLVACRPTTEPFRWPDDDARRLEMYFGDWSPGRFAWQFENVISIDPIPIKGQLRLFDPTCEVIDRVRDQLRGVFA